MLVKFVLSIGYPIAKQEDELEFPDDITDEQLDEALQDWQNNFIDSYWEKKEAQQ